LLRAIVGLAPQYRQLMVSAFGMKLPWSRARRLDRRQHGASGLTWQPRLQSVRWQAGPDRRADFIAAGYKQRLFFPHSSYCLPKCGPDAFRLGALMCGVRDPDAHWQVILYAETPAIDEFPPQLFFDPDVNWHQQHHFRVGQVASANMILKRSRAYTSVHQSDIVQRISRRREFKTRIENAFKGWHHLLLNALVRFALDRGVRTIRVPTSRLAMKHTAKNRNVQPELFERVYDRAVHHRFRAVADGDWWSIDVSRNRDAVVKLERREETIAAGRSKTICVCHDVERGLGHADVEPEFAVHADEFAPSALEEMLAIERRARVRATYCVVGSFLAEVRAAIESDGHCVAFHSYDHSLERPQLAACRQVDYRLPGYRPPRSVLTPELRGQALQWHGFQWLASSASSLATRVPRLEHRIVKIPILLDDYAMHEGKVTFDEWSEQVVRAVEDNDFVAISLHDAYAEHWLPYYERFLREISTFGQLKTLDEVAAEFHLSAGV
jgi:peptidoglycan/xylan/chitin deacetylase (PgdA/CDA1 family)